jgi:hypothetical protein
MIAAILIIAAIVIVANLADEATQKFAGWPLYKGEAFALYAIIGALLAINGISVLR